MTISDLYRRFDGGIPRDDMRMAEFQTYERYMREFARAAEYNFYRRALALVKSIAAWRIETHYPREINAQMLDKLGWALNKTRQSAVASLDLSKVAVTAAPASTA